MKLAMESISDGTKLLAAHKRLVGLTSKMVMFTTIKILEGKIETDVKRTGDEIEVTCIIEILGVKYVGKTARTFIKTKNSKEEGVDAMKREAREIAFKKYADADK